MQTLIDRRSIDIDILNDDAFNAVCLAADVLVKGLIKRAKASIGLGGLDLCDQIWPSLRNELPIGKVHLRLLPLSRLGAPEGKSGSHVIIVQFSAPTVKHVKHSSHPLVLKFAKIEPGAEDTVKDELKRFLSVRAYVKERWEHFAVPLDLPLGHALINGHSFLWSRFVGDFSIERVGGGPRHLLQQNDLWLQLRLRKSDAAHNVRYAGKKEDLIKFVFQILDPLHRRRNIKQRRTSVQTEYHEYLRGIWDADGTTGSRWWTAWQGIWGDDTKETAMDFGRTYANPFWVLAQLKGLSTNWFRGAIHGDLHPKNIVLSMNSPRLIDFGWTKRDAHIAKDFVLLEANLRFMVLRPNLDFKSVSRFANWLSFKDTAPPVSCPYCEERMRLVEVLRESARKQFPPDTSWDIEYLVPLFLVSFGLLKHLSDTENQIAARLTVLTLAQYISQKVLPVWPV